MRILVTPTSFPRTEASHAYVRLAACGGEIVWNPHQRPLTAEELPALLVGVDGWIAGLDFIDAEVLEHAPESLKVISRYGVGVERVDLQAARARGIAVTNTPGANTEAVADLAFGLMLSVARKIPQLDRRVKEGGWPRTTGMELFGKTIGIVGLGAIGKSVARRAAGFSMRVLAYDPWIDEKYCTKNGIDAMDLDTLLSMSDVVSLHLPLTAETSCLIDANRLQRMKNSAILVNTARGGIVDEVALLEALRQGKLGGVGLDAFAMEPPLDHSLLQFDNVVATPHAGAHTREAAERMAARSVENLVAVLLGTSCPYVVN